MRASPTDYRISPGVERVGTETDRPCLTQTAPTAVVSSMSERLVICKGIHAVSRIPVKQGLMISMLENALKHYKRPSLFNIKRQLISAKEKETAAEEGPNVRLIRQRVVNED